MKRLVVSLFVIIFGSLVLGSCGTEDADSAEMSATAETVLRESETGIIRGLNLNASAAEVKAAEKANTLVSEAEDKLEYTIKAGTDEIALLYLFDQEGLYKINISIKAENAKTAKKTEADFIAFFNGKYGEGKKEKGVSFWELPDDRLSVEVSQKMKNTELIIKYFE